MWAPPLFIGKLMNKLTLEDQDRAICAVSRAGMSLLTICEQVTDPELQSKLNTVLDDVRFANNVLYQRDNDANVFYN